MGLSIGLDIGGTKIAGGLVDPSGQLPASARRATPARDPQLIAVAAGDIVRELVAGAEGDVVAVGVAAAGLVDRDRSTVVFAPNLAWRDEPLKAHLEALVSMPVVIENDANAAAWGEFRFGAAGDVDDMVLVTVGTGIGGGIVMDGKLIRGSFGAAAELGHVRVVPGGHRCGCGNRGCWEQYASGSALVREARELVASGTPYAARLTELCEADPARLSGPIVTGAAREGDPAAVELLTDLGTWLGEGISAVTAVLDPRVVVIGGGVADAGELLLEPARAAFRRLMTGRGHRPEPELRLARLGNSAGMVGAADLARVG
jgi:glucokinase